MKNIQLRCRLVSLLIILMLMIGWKNPILMFQTAFAQRQSSWTFALFAIGTAFLVLNLLTAVGLFLMKNWGFILAYIAIPFSTIFLSTPYIPLLINNFPVHIYQYKPIIIVNLIVLFYVIYLHIGYRRKLANK